MTAEEVANEVTRALQGDLAARESLVRWFLRPAHAVALGVVRNVSDAEDIAQDCLMTALTRLDQCRDPHRFAAWLFQSVRMASVRRAIQTAHRNRLVGQHSDTAAGSVPPDDVPTRHSLAEALGTLSDIQREVVLLHDMLDWRHQEIAEALGLSETNSRQQLFLARRALRAQLATDQREEGSRG